MVKHLFPKGIPAIIQRITMATFAIENIIDATLKEHGLVTLSQFRVLVALQIGGRQTQREIAKMWRVSEASIKRQVDSLINVGYVVRHNDDVDRRKSGLSLTFKGRRAFVTSFKVFSRKFDAIFKHYPPDTQKRILTDLDEFLTYIGPNKPF